MPTAPEYDLAIIGAGAAGLIAADFALQLGARVALLERDRIGGDCTWTGCVPSKALVKAAGVAHEVREAERYGVRMAPPAAAASAASIARPATNMSAVRAYLETCIQHIYSPTTPEALRAKGLDVILGATRFLDPHTLEAGGAHLKARRVLICTGARPRIPDLLGLSGVPYLTYRTVFELDRLPVSLLVIGAGPVGCELTQCYQRLGSEVTLVAELLLPRAEPEARERLAEQFSREGIRRLAARAEAVGTEGDRVWVRTASGVASGQRLLLATGRVPAVQELALESAGVRCGERGIEVDARLRTSAAHIYAAGDVLGGAQFSHLAGWQAFQAVRNALLPGWTRALPRAVPEVTFTAPEIAHVGLIERLARSRFGDAVKVGSLDLRHVDRAVTENDPLGLVKLVARRDGRLLGATIMGQRAGEAIGELTLALSQRLTLRELAASIHPYPTYNSAIQLLATQMALEQRLSGRSGIYLRALSRRTEVP